MLDLFGYPQNRQESFFALKTTIYAKPHNLTAASLKLLNILFIFQFQKVFGIKTAFGI